MFRNVLRHTAIANALQHFGRKILSCACGVQHPADNTHEQSHSRFIYFEHVFERYAEITQKEDGYDN